jgi:hypothetical protein
MIIFVMRKLLLPLCKMRFLGMRIYSRRHRRSVISLNIQFSDLYTTLLCFLTVATVTLYSNPKTVCFTQVVENCPHLHIR